MKRYLLLSLLCVGTLSLSAQSQFFNLKNWQLAKISVHAGMDKDMLGDLQAKLSSNSKTADVSAKDFLKSKRSKL